MSEQPDAPDPEQLDRLRAAFAAIEPGADEGPPTIDPERIWAAARGELDPEQTAAIVDRLHRDPQLALEWRLARELADPHQPIAPAANDRRYLGVAAVVVALAAAALLITLVRAPMPDPSGVDQPPVVRGDGDDPALTTPLAERAVVSRAGFELRWSALARASRYELRVSSEALEPVYEAFELDQARAEVPGEALAGREPGEVLIWQVTAVLDDGARVSGPAWRVVLR